MAANYATMASVEASYPELAGKVTQAMVDLGKQFVNIKVWGEKASFGHAAVVAHLVAAGLGSGATVASKTAGSVSISYAVPAATSDWQTTPYGKHYLMLRNTLSPMVMFGFRERT